jgi:hypothetical protein
VLLVSAPDRETGAATEACASASLIPIFGSPALLMLVAKSKIALALSLNLPSAECEN